MIGLIKRISKEQYWDYFVLIARCLLGFTFLNYGYSKLTGNQFGITEAELSSSIKDISLFRLSWYLFDHEPFKTFIGVSQILCAFLLIFNRTILFGALLFLPIVINILVIDLTFMPANLANAFAWRLSFYIVLDLLILWHYKERIKVVLRELSQNVKPKFRFPIWAYLILPVCAIFLEIVGVIPRILTSLLLEPSKTFEQFKATIEYVNSLF